MRTKIYSAIDTWDQADTREFAWAVAHEPTALEAAYWEYKTLADAAEAASGARRTELTGYAEEAYAAWQQASNLEAGQERLAAAAAKTHWVYESDPEGMDPF